ncbi:MAG: CpaF family protein [Anaerovoracaceae bacterium]
MVEMNVIKVIENVRNIISEESSGLTDEKVIELIEEMVLTHIDNEISFKEVKDIVYKVFYSIRSDVSILQPYIEDNEVCEIMVNGKDSIFIEKNGKIINTQTGFTTNEELENLIRRIAGKVHREINELNPIVDARLTDGSRVNAVYKNVALNGPILTIRKFPKVGITMEDLIEFGTITKDAAAFLKILVKSRYNIFVSGGTSSGKTTFLNVLSNFIPSNERVIVIEDSAELKLDNIENIVRLECKNATSSGKGEVTMEQLIKTSLRMRPDRIIVGEVRGKEIMSMLVAMNTGHDGSISTGHGNSVEGMLKRMEAMYLQAVEFPIEAIRAQIVEGIDIIVHLGRLSDMSRKVLSIAEIVELRNGKFETNVIYNYEIDDGLVRTGNNIIRREKLKLSDEDYEYM